MPPAEIPHRIAEAVRSAAWRRDISGWRAFEANGDGALTDLTALRRRLRTAAAVDSVRLAAETICSGRFTFLGENWPQIPVKPGEPLRIPRAFWFHDPITGKSWPDAAMSSFDLDVRSTGTDIGDVKYVWEPNRLQMLHPLAAAMAGTQDREAQRTAFAIIGSWAAANPPYRGINWKSGIEVALRLVSIALVVAAAEPSALGAEQRVLIRRMIAAHARYLLAFPSLYSSANNHRVAEGLGLFLAGILSPDLDTGRRWLGEGRRILESEAVHQILDDGVGVEQSPTYQAFTMEMLAFAALLAGDLGTPLDPKLTERLVRGAQYLSLLADENGFVPAIGDDDEGRVLSQPPDREPRYVASVIAAVVGLTKHSDLALSTRDPHLRDAVFNGPPMQAAARSRLRIFEQGGNTIVNETIAGRRIHLVFDHGPLGMMPLAAHGHADALSIWLTVDGDPVFVDAGTYRYFSGGETRTALRESQAHNTLTVAGQSHSRPATGFGWITAAHARLIAADRGAKWHVVGAHDGYRKRFGVRHVRRIERTANGFAIDDRLADGRRPLPVALRFLCHPEVTVELNRDCIALGGRRGPLCRIIPPPGFLVETAEAMYSQCFGQIAPAPQLVFSGELASGSATTLIEFDQRAAPAAG